MKDEWDDANANFKWREGRRYASDNNYVLPVDDTEVDRLQIQHEVWRNRLGGCVSAILGGDGRRLSSSPQRLPLNFVVPVKDVLEKGGKVLDMG
ncbi:hypothetical protein BC936DRAFT_141261 [Jimgerdemannia flammicorona]|uniref:Uncharacterized protein n=1 Tax=Jimgerdemannia flammicorona TaxID=994334 RepID=A0A433A2K5_9FUNG|nr:hypothetical protein BC936DRAFT_141261 [Jimgerdemannia flammicorona]